MNVFLKADIHIHTAEDPFERLKYSAEELIDRGANLDYQVLSITNHDTVTFSSHLENYARERGIVLIPGVEAFVEGRHVLIYNIEDYFPGRFPTLQHLYDNKPQDSLVIAPHPYFPTSYSLNGLFEKNLSVFDAIEYSHFYISFINYNRQAEVVSRNHQIPMVGTSDVHFLQQLGLKGELDIEYRKNTSQQRNKLDFIHPKNKVYEQAPLFIYIHGGGNTGGTKNALYNKSSLILKELTEAGIAVATIDYRVFGQGEELGFHHLFQGRSVTIQFFFFGKISFFIKVFLEIVKLWEG